jgi:hypothetical protein
MHTDQDPMPRSLYYWTYRLAIPVGKMVLLPGIIASGKKHPIDAVAVDLAMRAGLYSQLPPPHLTALKDSLACALFNAPATPEIVADRDQWGDKGDDPPLHARQLVAQYAEGACALLTAAIPKPIVGEWDIKIAEDETLRLTPRLDDGEGDCWCEIAPDEDTLEQLGGHCPCVCHDLNI